MKQETSLDENARALIGLIKIAAERHETLVDELSSQISNRLSKGNKIFWCGNGGSAAESQHMAAELMGRFLINRRPLPSVSLTTDTSVITAVSNDFNFNEIFARQLIGLGSPGDILVSFSTSGESTNIINAITAAKENQILTISFIGKAKSTIGSISDFAIDVHSESTARIQEVHTLIAHTLCQKIEANIFG